MNQVRELMGGFVRTAEAGRLLGLSGRTLEKHRTCGTGPVYRKLGGRVVYAINDLRAWADEDVRSSTTSRLGGSPTAQGGIENRERYTQG